MVRVRRVRAKSLISVSDREKKEKKGGGKRDNVGKNNIRNKIASVKCYVV